MSITIDQTGRVVIPKAIRDQLHLVSGSELEIDASGNEIRLRVADLEPSLIQKRGVLVHHGTKQSDLDITDFLRNERENRSTSIAESPSK
ncbi:AbrB/MazE/SpoVT family DNA-binding domain-containing protein [bacterium]|nr:AbrB/MazE/SpoVT family DNA-binding domain-containing protein [bacterium]